MSARNHLAGLIGLSGLLAGSLCGALASPATLVEWKFDRDGDLKGWQPNSHLTNVIVTNGALHCRAVGADPILEFQPRLDIPATPWQVVEIRFKADHDGICELFWSGTDQGRYGGFSQEKSTRFPVTGDNEWHKYRLRPFWHTEKRLMRLRFDVYDAARFELESLRVLEPATSAATTNAEFDFSSGAAGWQGLDGASVTNDNGTLSIILNDRLGFAAAPPEDLDASRRFWVSVRMSVNRGRYATLLFATASRSGLQHFSFPINADGRERNHNLNLRASPHWRDRVIALALRPSDDPTATAHLRSFQVTEAPQGEPEIEVVSLGIEEFPARANRPLTLAARVENSGGSAVSNLNGIMRLQPGVEVLSNLVTTFPTLRPGEMTTLRWSIQSKRPPHGEASVNVSSANAAAANLTAKLQFTAIPKVSQRDYVPKPEPVRGPFEVGVYYFPGWQDAKRWQPIRPYPERRPVLGWYREGEPEVADWHIKWAVEHGITFFIYDWYWSCGQRQLEHALHDGYFNARYRSILKFCLLWANHNPPGTHSMKDCLAVTRFWIENFFRRPEHVTVDGKPLMVIFAPQRLSEDLGATKVHSALDAMRAECARAGLKGLYFVACVGDAAQAREAAAMGFDGVTAYTWPHLGMPAGEYRAPYATLLEGYRRNWEHILETAGIPLLPPVCGGWDSRPWHGENNFIRFDRTPDLFRKHLRDARRLLESRPGDARLRNLLIIEAWNEWGEGSYIEPHTEFGFGYLDAIRDALTDSRGPHTDVAPIDLGRGLYDVATEDR